MFCSHSRRDFIRSILHESRKADIECGDYYNAETLEDGIEGDSREPLNGARSAMIEIFHSFRRSEEKRSEHEH